MEKVLMHGNTEVARFFQDPNGAHVKIKELINETLFPDNTPDLSVALQRWLLMRRRPSLVGRFAEARNFYGEEAFSSKSLRSLTDMYWVKDEKDDIEWEEIDPRNGWEPEFDSIFLMLYNPSELEGMDMDSPNVTTYGPGTTIWGEVQGEIVLLNENAQTDVEKYRIAKQHKIDIVAPRQYVIKKGCVFSYRQLDIDEDTERIPLDFYYNRYANPEKTNEENLSVCFSSIGITNWKDYIINLIKFDKICGNKTRELSSLGIIRNSKTLECVGIDRL